ncbi:SGNH/GDSL hydrolase family protein [Deinococcus sp. Leaf326]|uniref:SGNH/GDSL hydrolase family protein n=1 Tax=Deinococcus sp. Leaf326 TaxID=1736338 RepID=UPI0006F3B42E|nr:SGNH/GDSL hydrolase family protein [Deinococcus sp. Leaf326]KQR02418.1 hypothetical protein ASF71_21475 [Deinococcus sp. Leaf326]
MSPNRSTAKKPPKKVSDTNRDRRARRGEKQASPEPKPALGSGGVPGALKNQLFYYALRPDPGRYAAQVKVVTVNLGTNDAGRGIGDAAFQADYTSLLTLLKARYPNAKILALLPFNGVYAGAIQAAVAAAGNRAQYVDTTGWVTTFTDGTHPDQQGHSDAEGKLAPVIQSALTAQPRTGRCDGRLHKQRPRLLCPHRPGPVGAVFHGRVR